MVSGADNGSVRWTVVLLFIVCQSKFCATNSTLYLLFVSIPFSQIVTVKKVDFSGVKISSYILSNTCLHSVWYVYKYNIKSKPLYAQFGTFINTTFEVNHF